MQTSLVSLPRSPPPPLGPSSSFSLSHAAAGLIARAAPTLTPPRRRPSPLPMLPWVPPPPSCLPTTVVSLPLLLPWASPASHVLPAAGCSPPLRPWRPLPTVSSYGTRTHGRRAGKL
uniref:Uncharacterized protein n=1 Tax=Setaria viridis TaxID=4556 RepID=A0A4U6VHH8_SETVI|nr:hypothetical protein SEVIR_3G289550v2 [Setaria viridis]